MVTNMSSCLWIEESERFNPITMKMLKIGSDIPNVVKILGNPDRTFSQPFESILKYDKTLIFIRNNHLGHVALKSSKHVGFIVNSINASHTHEPYLKEKKYFIAPANNRIRPNELAYLEFSAFVKKVLVSKGYYCVDQISEADGVIFLDFGIVNSTKKLKTWSNPLYGLVNNGEAIQSSYYSTSATDGRLSSLISSDLRYDSQSNHSDIDRMSTYSRPELVVEEEAEIYFDQHLVLTAYDLENFRLTHEEKQLWKTELFSTNQKRDLREIFPLLTVAIRPYIGVDTNHQIFWLIAVDDPQITKLRNSVISNKGFVDELDIPITDPNLINDNANLEQICLKNSMVACEKIAEKHEMAQRMSQAIKFYEEACQMGSKNACRRAQYLHSKLKN